MGIIKKKTKQLFLFFFPLFFPPGLVRLNNLLRSSLLIQWGVQKTVVAGIWDHSKNGVC